VVEVSSAEAIRQAVAAGQGVAVLPSWATGLEEKEGRQSGAVAANLMLRDDSVDGHILEGQKLSTGFCKPTVTEP